MLRYSIVPFPPCCFTICVFPAVYDGSRTRRFQGFCVKPFLLYTNPAKKANVSVFSRRHTRKTRKTLNLKRRAQITALSLFSFFSSFVSRFRIFGISLSCPVTPHRSDGYLQYFLQKHSGRGSLFGHGQGGRLQRSVQHISTMIPIARISPLIFRDLRRGSVFRHPCYIVCRGFIRCYRNKVKGLSYQHESPYISRLNNKY